MAAVKGPMYLTEDQIIDLYRKATAAREQIRETSLVRDLDRQFFASVGDFALYTAFVLVRGVGSPPVWIGLAIFLSLGRWVPIGPISTIFWLNYRGEKERNRDPDLFGVRRKSTNKEKLKLLHWINHPETATAEDKKINPYSLTVMRTVAEALTQPLLDSATQAEEKLASQRETVEALIEETDRLCAEIRTDRLQAGDLEDVFDTRLTEARDTSKELHSELQRIEKALWNIKTEIAPLRAYLGKLRELEDATRKLAGIRDRMASTLGVPADPIEMLELQQLPLRVEQARANLNEIGVSLKAYEAAVAEVEQLKGL